MGIQFKQCSRSSELVGSRDSVISSIENISRPILRELVIAELEQANVRSSALLRIEIGFDLGNGLHEIEIQTKGVRRALDFFNRGPTGTSFSESRIVSGGFISGGTSE